jgi:hypothetical protein
MEHLDQLIDILLTDDAHSEEYFNAVSSLAKLSREEETVRNRLASKDALQRLTKILKTHPRTPSTGDLLAATLRCVGNACVSNPEACATATEYKFDWYHAFLVPRNCNLRQSNKSPNYTPAGSQHWDVPPAEVRELTIKVLYNICSQSEEAQKLCYIGGVDIQIFTMLEGCDTWPVENLSLAIDLLFWVTSHHKELAKDEDAKKTHSPGRDTNVLFLGHWCMASRAVCLLWDKVDVEDYATLLESILVFFRDPAALTEINSTAPIFFLIWRILTCIERKIKEAEGDAEDVKLLAALSTSFTWVLSDISATPAFAYQVTTNQGGKIRVFVEDLSQLLTTGVAVSRVEYTADADEIVDGDALRLHSAACQIFGNMLHGQSSPEDHINGIHHQDRAAQLSMFDILTSDVEQPPIAIQDRHTYQRLFALMTTCDNADFLHSAAGFLIQLSRPSPEVRAEIASDDNALAAIRRLGEHPMQQLNQDALMLMRALGKDTPSVQEKLKELAGEVMATVAETQKAAADAQAEQPAIANIA